MSKYIVTGHAGFIGYHLTKRLLEEGHSVVGIDNFNDYYDPKLKRYRNDRLDKWIISGMLKTYSGGDLRQEYIWENISSDYGMDIDAIYHLAALPGVRNSIQHPGHYIENNIDASINVLVAAGEYGIGKVILASSSSVYGDSAWCPNSLMKQYGPDMTSEKQATDKPLSPYAMSKIAMELAGYTYHKLYGYDVIIPRFFTVYGPAGRPDMAYYIFIQKALAGESIDVFGDGEQVRDFTYIDDIVDGLIGLPGLTGYECVNLGSGSPCSLNDLIEQIGKVTGVSISRNQLESQPGDVHATFANNAKAWQLLGWEPKWSLEDGIAEIVRWFQSVDLSIFEGVS